jgi:hypothetical protein
LNYQIGDTSKKGIYLDGHERADVVAYRKTFLNEMEIYLKRMPVYAGGEMELRIMPELPESIRPLIMVVRGIKKKKIFGLIITSQNYDFFLDFLVFRQLPLISFFQKFLLNEGFGFTFDIKQKMHGMPLERNY